MNITEAVEDFYRRHVKADDHVISRSYSSGPTFAFEFVVYKSDGANKRAFLSADMTIPGHYYFALDPRPVDEATVPERCVLPPS